MRAKVFGIGFHKTGTTSLGRALEAFGYRVAHGAREARASLGQDTLMALLYGGAYDRLLDTAAPFDALVDNPWFLLFRELDERWPGSKFILTTRDESRWLRSAVAYYGSSESDLRYWIYGVGSPIGHEDLWLERYRAHGRAVRAYFADRPDDLLIVDWEEGDGWQALSTFVDRPVPSAVFPHDNPSRGVTRTSVARILPPGISPNPL